MSLISDISLCTRPESRNRYSASCATAIPDGRGREDNTNVIKPEPGTSNGVRVEGVGGLLPLRQYLPILWLARS
jgi:hypothetical protein